MTKTKSLSDFAPLAPDATLQRSRPKMPSPADHALFPSHGIPTSRNTACRLDANAQPRDIEDFYDTKERQQEVNILREQLGEEHPDVLSKQEEFMEYEEVEKKAKRSNLASVMEIESILPEELSSWDKDTTTMVLEKAIGEQCNARIDQLKFQTIW